MLHVWDLCPFVNRSIWLCTFSKSLLIRSSRDLPLEAGLKWIRVSNSDRVRFDLVQRFVYHRVLNCPRLEGHEAMNDGSSSRPTKFFDVSLMTVPLAVPVLLWLCESAKRVVQARREQAGVCRQLTRLPLTGFERCSWQVVARRPACRIFGIG